MSNDPYVEKPWLKFYDEGGPTEIDFPEMNISQFLDNAAKEFGSRTAIWFLEHKISYKKFKDISLSDYSYSEDDNPSGIGLRYIPFLNIEEVINEESSIDFEVLLNIYSTGSFEETSGNSQTDSREKDSNVKLYRAKLRYVSIAATPSETNAFLKLSIASINGSSLKLLNSSFSVEKTALKTRPRA